MGKEQSSPQKFAKGVDTGDDEVDEYQNPLAFVGR